ncbi:hypothetical protein [Pandoraea sp. ISTKB]|uniref:hypothetical protein n=1 Tax=Pandoraea sp. ISTKB TaxID=1586708 RepID=UPI0008476B51|nr:hypothetical protein [Pandoraea sp. ISTKB]ODP35106.1 hypothetical protein A9762_12140 [Pandoraea sp. ISTKB]
MQVAAKVLEGGEVVAIGADGKPFGEGDVDCRMLHVLPKFFAPATCAQYIRSHPVELQVKCSFGEVVPDGGIKIRQPYPNQRYFVGGSETLRNGWLVKIPEGVAEFELEFVWIFSKASGWTDFEVWRVEHAIQVQLLPGEKNVYTMDAACWPYNAETQAKPRSAVTLAGVYEDGPDAYEERDIISISHEFRSSDGERGDSVLACCYRIEERLGIPSIAYEKAWTLHAFQDEQLHEVGQDGAFNPADDLAHSANAEIELPAQIFLDAIRLAQSVPFDAQSEFGLKCKGVMGGCESHPALKLLTEWWAAHCSDAAPLGAGSVMPWVRVRDDGLYWCGDRQVPNMPVDSFGSVKAAAALIGKSVLLHFSAAAQHFTFDANGVNVRYVTGEIDFSIGVDESEVRSGEFDQAWEALGALANFPYHFSAAYSELERLAEQQRDAEAQ